MAANKLKITVQVRRRAWFYPVFWVVFAFVRLGLDAEKAGKFIARLCFSYKLFGGR